MSEEVFRGLRDTAIRVMSKKQLHRYFHDPEYHAAVYGALRQAAVDFEKTVVPVIEGES